MTIPTVAPSKFTQGLTVKWTVDPGDDYRPSASWVLTYYFTNATLALSVTATDNGDGRFLVTIPASGAGTDTTDFTAGDYDFEGRVSKSGEAYCLDRGRVTVEASPSTAVDRRSYARKALDDIRACIAGRIPKAQIAQYQINSSSGTWGTNYTSLQELREAEAYYAGLCREEDARDRRARGQATGGRILTEFRQ